MSGCCSARSSACCYGTTGQGGPVCPRRPQFTAKFAVCKQACDGARPHTVRCRVRRGAVGGGRAHLTVIGVGSGQATQLPQLRGAAGGVGRVVRASAATASAAAARESANRLQNSVIRVQLPQPLISITCTRLQVATTCRHDISRSPTPAHSPPGARSHARTVING